MRKATPPGATFSSTPAASSRVVASSTSSVSRRWKTSLAPNVISAALGEASDARDAARYTGVAEVHGADKEEESRWAPARLIAFYAAAIWANVAISAHIPEISPNPAVSGHSRRARPARAGVD